MAARNPPPIVLSEEYVQEAFHSFLRSSLSQAKVEGLLGVDVLSSAEADLMITGPALCLYFAALRSTTNPPSVPLPRRTKASAPVDLSSESCPLPFRQFWAVWSQSVPEIQALVPEHQHDLARIICGLLPLCKPPNARLNGIAADLRAVAIEISMRRTFQDRYANDLQAALDAGTGGNTRLKASFVPPPGYEAPRFPSPISTTTPPNTPRKSSRKSHVSSPTLSPIPPSQSRAPSPSILSPTSPAIELIRETLYAALADVLERMPHLRQLVRTDPIRGYFAAVAFAILDVATGSATHPSAPSQAVADVLPRSAEPSIRGVLGQTLLLSNCPEPLRPFMAELCDIGKTAAEIEEQDSLASVQALQKGQEPPVPRLDKVRDILEHGVGNARLGDETSPAQEDRRAAARQTNGSDGYRHVSRPRTTSTENRAVVFANRINALALGMTKLRAFRERQEMVFKVLVGLGG
ncbi:hypothetical protein SCP_1203410 [Sparassis crispa]|uniref:Uncharacterized protein n=1 Tax=Sparassis crispa TaxID=139825 RepID=A0A401H111_9APHY|nr:hypothetical protein SCP_1203410 [Sparassis crispa]GBE88111.1 hypothetical protein SCP_1203410 [Sparassis crispa]